MTAYEQIQTAIQTAQAEGRARHEIHAWVDEIMDTIRDEAVRRHYVQARTETK